MSEMGGAPQPALDWAVDIPFVQHLGFELMVFEAGEAEIRYRPAPEHLNSFGVTHGGACMTLLDVALASAARSVAPEMGAVTIEMKTSFMRPATAPASGQYLRAVAKLMHRTATLAFTQGSLFDANGELCAHATGTFKLIKRLPTGSKSINPLRQVATD